MTFLKTFRPNAGKEALALAVIALGAGIWILPACSAQTGAESSEAADSDVLATIGANSVTRAEIQTEAESGLEQAKMQKLQCESTYERTVHQVMETTLERVVRDRVLTEEAKTRGITREELIEAEVEAKVGEVSDEEVDAFYAQNQAQIRQPKEQVAAQIRQHLGRQVRDTVYNDFITGLEAKSNVDYKLGPYRVEVAAEGPSKGPDSAPVTIVEFSDFQCPYCSRVVPSMNKVHEKYGDKVQVVFRHFPLQFHAEAQKAAEASLCAHDQGKFWEMHDLMFEEQSSLQVADLKDKAKRLELEEAAFGECLDSGKYFEAVQEDMRAGVLAGVSGTPAMFINGRFVSGAQPYENIAEVIDEELARLSVN